jgi:hypothetical protein
LASALAKAGDRLRRWSYSGNEISWKKTASRHSAFGQFNLSKRYIVFLENLFSWVAEGTMHRAAAERNYFWEPLYITQKVAWLKLHPGEYPEKSAEESSMKQRDVRVIFSECDGYCEALDRNGCISYPVTITWSLVGNVDGRPLVVILGDAREPNAMPPGELQVPFEILNEVRQAGYGAQQLSVRDIKDYWREAGWLHVNNHWHPQARLVQY